MFTTHATLSELLGVDGRGEVEAPRVVGRRVLPVHEALRRLSYPRPCKQRKKNSKLSQIPIVAWLIPQLRISAIRICNSTT